MTIIRVLLSSALLIMAWGQGFADNERIIPFQGRLTNVQGEPLDGAHRITFAIYDQPTGGTAQWVEVHEAVSIQAGVVNVLLGSITALDDPDGNGDASDAVDFSVPRFLGMKVGEDANQEMVPRQQVVPAFHAREADQLAADSPDRLPRGVIVMWSGSVAEIPAGWTLCDGRVVEGIQTPDLRDRFILSVGAGENPGATDGAHSYQLSEAQMPAHSHGGSTGSGGGHNHTYTGIDTLSERRGLYNYHYMVKRSKTKHTSNAPNHTHTINPAGSGASIDNRPAFYKLAFIIKL